MTKQESEQEPESVEAEMNFSGTVNGAAGIVQGDLIIHNHIYNNGKHPSQKNQHKTGKNIQEQHFVKQFTYKGKTIPIDDENKISITDLYNVAGKPPNREPTRFKKSTLGASIIKEYEEKQGRGVWESRQRQTLAIVPLACAYLKYCGDLGAANVLEEVVKTGKYIPYNPSEPILEPISEELPEELPTDSYYASSGTGLGCFITIIIIVGLIFSGGFLEYAQQQIPDEQPSPPSNSSLDSSANAVKPPRCGWLINPAEGDWYLKDRDARWTLSLQGEYQARGMNNVPRLSTSEKYFVSTNGAYGHFCVCLDVETDINQRAITVIQGGKQQLLSICRKDRKLPAL